MRPVNLIPPDERRGDSAPSRTGSLSWIVVGVLGVILFAVTMIVLTNKSISDKESEVAALEREEQELQARAQNLSSFVTFKQAQQARSETISSLADSRFDWERVMRELSRVIPDRAWLVNLTGTVSPEVSLENAAGVGLRGSVPGPAIELVGCARSQDVVARLITAIGDIDGVTRVAVPISEKPGNKVTGASSDETSADCRTRSFLTKFELVAAFDSVAAPDSVAPGAPTTPPAAPEDSESAPASDSTPADGGVSDAQQVRKDGQQDASQANSKAQQAANIVPGGGG